MHGATLQVPALEFWLVWLSQVHNECLRVVSAVSVQEPHPKETNCATSHGPDLRVIGVYPRDLGLPT